MRMGSTLIRWNPLQPTKIFVIILDYRLITFAAWRPFGPWVMSKSTSSPSNKDLKPSPSIAEKWTNTSSPSSCSIKPKPLLSLNHFTLPSANCLHHLSILKFCSKHLNKKGKESELLILALTSFFRSIAQETETTTSTRYKRYTISFQKSSLFCQIRIKNGLFIICTPKTRQRPKVGSKLKTEKGKQLGDTIFLNPANLTYYLVFPSLLLTA